MFSWLVDRDEWWSRYHGIDHVSTRYAIDVDRFHFLLTLSRWSSAICVIVPALIGIGVCAIIYFAHRNKDRKLQRPTSMNRAHEGILQEWNEFFSHRLRIWSLHNDRRRSNVKGQRFHSRITLETRWEISNLCIGTREFSFMTKERDTEWARRASFAPAQQISDDVVYSVDAPSSYDYPRARERESRNVYTIDFSRASRYQPPSPPRRPRPPPPIIEQAPPSYDVSIKETRREVKPRFSSVRTIPSSNQVRRSSPVISPSIYSTMPPSYAEIFLTTHTSANGWSLLVYLYFSIFYRFSSYRNYVIERKGEKHRTIILEYPLFLGLLLCKRWDSNERNCADNRIPRREIQERFLRGERMGLVVAAMNLQHEPSNRSSRVKWRQV